MKSKINFRQRKLAEQKSLVLILAPKTGRKKKKMEAGSSLRVAMWREINNEQGLGQKKRATFKNSIQTNENILLPMVSKINNKKDD